MGLKKSWVELTPPRLNSTQLFRIPKSPLCALARVLMVCFLHWVVRKFAIHEHLYFACRFRITQGWDVNLTPESVMLILCSNSPSFRRGLTRKWMIFWTVLKKTMSIRVGCKINTRAVAQHEFRFTSPSLNIRSTLDRHGKNIKKKFRSDTSLLPSLPPHSLSLNTSRDTVPFSLFILFSWAYVLSYFRNFHSNLRVDVWKPKKCLIFFIKL